MANPYCKQAAGKRTGMALLLLLTAFVLAFAFVPRAALADEATDSGSGSAADEIDPFEFFPLSVTASTDGLPDDQVQITVANTNEVGIQLTDHAVSFKVPDGWHLVSGSLSSSAATTNNGESVSTVAVLAKGSSSGDGAGSDSGAASTPKTGDPFAVLAIIIAIIVVAAVALFSGRKLRFHSTLSVAVSALLVFSLLPVGALQAMADEVKGSSGSDSLDADSPFTLSKTVDVDARGESLAIEASVSCSVASDVAPGVVNLELKRPIPVGASSVNVTVLSEVAYAGASETDGEYSTFDSSKIGLSGTLEGASVRQGAYTVKVEGENEQSSELKDRTHYELRFIIDGIPEGAASEDSDYGYIELTDQPFNDQEQGYGVACVSYSTPAASIAQVTSESPMGSDVTSHTFDNGKYFDGTNRFRVPVDLDGIEVGMPIPTTSEFAAYATGDTFTIDGVEYRMFTNEDIVRGISFNVTDYKIKVVECTEDLGYTWLTFQVDDATGADAYKELTKALTECGVLFGGQITSTYLNTIAYPRGVTDGKADTDAAGNSTDPFAYAETSPVAYAYAVQLDRGAQNTTVTYLAGLRSSQEAEDETEVGDIDLLDETTFTAYRISTDKSGTSTETAASDIAVKPSDANKDVFQIEVTVSNSQFDSDIKLLGISASDKSSLFEAMHTYLGNVNLRMTGGSTNAFGVPEKDADVALFDGESFSRANKEDGASDSGNSSSSGAGEASMVSLLADSNAGNSTNSTDITTLNPKYDSFAGAVGAVQTQAGENVKQMDQIYRKSSSDSASDKRMKQILSSAVTTGLGVNHAINLVTVLGKSFLNYATAGFTIVGFLGVFVMDLLPQETQMYTVDDVMNKLDEMNKKIDTVETTVKTINVKLDEQGSKSSWELQSNTYTNLKSLLCSKTTTYIFQGMDNVLGNYYELDENGNKTDKACSRSTSISRMPKEAIDALDEYLQGIDNNAKNKGFQTGIGGAYTALHNLLVPGESLSSNILDTYYEYVNSRYNWDVETKAAKRAFLASFMIMYNNAYALYSAELSVKLYRAKDKTGSTASVEVDMKELQDYANDISTVLYGEVDWEQLRKDYPGASKTSTIDKDVTATDIDTDKLKADNPGKEVNEIIQEKYLTKSKYMTAATDTDYTEVKFIATDSVRQRTYSTSNYVLGAAYDENCFATTYLSGMVTDLNKGNDWQPKCSFETNELKTMAARLNALPASMRPTITDSDGKTRPVENIAEEMEAIGFKTQDPTAQFKKQLLKLGTSVMQAREEKIIGNSKASLWAQNGSTTDVWATVGANDSNPADEVDRYSDQARNWNYFFTEFGYNINYQNGKKIRLQYACDLSSNNKRLISGVDLGTKITDPQNYIVLSADKAKAAVSTWGGSGYGSQLPTTVAARYGKVFNMKTGDVVDNQLLYAVEVQVWFLPMITMGKLSNAVRCEYYPFGELSITESGRSPLMSNYKTWYQTNWYAQGINDGNYSGSQNNSIDIRRYNQNTD